MNNPQRNIIGKRKKLEKVWASKTSFTATEMNNPRKVLVEAVSRILPTSKGRGTQAVELADERADLAGIQFLGPFLPLTFA